MLISELDAWRWFSMRPGRVKSARKYRISGRVQGVGFRYFAERAAHAQGISGYVKNCPDGTVEVYAIGDAPALEVFKHRLAEGPRSAWVEAVEESEMPVNERYREFLIEGGW
jgi:acylphosphatase